VDEPLIQDGDREDGGFLHDLPARIRRELCLLERDLLQPIHAHEKLKNIRVRRSINAAARLFPVIMAHTIFSIELDVNT